MAATSTANGAQGLLRISSAYCDAVLHANCASGSAVIHGTLFISFRDRYDADAFLRYHRVSLPAPPARIVIDGDRGEDSLHMTSTFVTHGRGFTDGSAGRTVGVAFRSIIENGARCFNSGHASMDTINRVLRAVHSSMAHTACSVMHIANEPQFSLVSAADVSFDIGCC